MTMPGIRIIMLVVSGMATLAVVAVTLMIGVNVAGPFFEQVGDNATIAGISANEAVDMELALALTALSVLAIPGGIAMVLFFRGRGRGERRPPRRP